MLEVNTIYQNNLRSILKTFLSKDAFDANNLRLKKTANLLTTKEASLSSIAEGLNESQSTSILSRSLWLEQLNLSLLQGHYLIFSSEFEVAHGDESRHKEKNFNALAMFAQSVTQIEQFEAKFNQDLAVVQERSNTYDILAKHCVKLLEKYPNENLTESIAQNVTKAALEVTSRSVLEVTIMSYLRGLRYGSEYCRERVIHLISLFYQAQKILPHIKTVFSLYLEQFIPVWSYLTWAAQIMGSLDLPIGEIVQPILEKLAATYPKALHYSYRITREGFGPQGKRLSQGLARLLKDTSVDSFIAALTSLTHPEQRWNDGLNDLSSALDMFHNTKEISKENVLQAYDRAVEDLLLTEAKGLGVKFGRYNERFIEFIKRKLDKIDAKEGLIDKKRYKATFEALKALSSKDQWTRQFASGKCNLKEFSLWLSEFDPSRHDLEVPGLYGYNLHRPPLKTNDRITSFGSSVLVMSSIRMPKKLVIIGSSGKEYSFLCKGGEDIRTDERIQALFAEMNRILLKHHRNSGNHSSALQGVSGAYYSVDEILLLGQSRLWTFGPLVDRVDFFARCFYRGGGCEGFKALKSSRYSRSSASKCRSM